MSEILMSKADIAMRNKYINAMMNFANSRAKSLSEGDALSLINYIRHKEDALSELAVKMVNGKDTEIDRQKWDKTTRQISRLIKKRIGCSTEFCDDPRGHCIRLHLKDKSTDFFYNSPDAFTKTI